MHMCIYIYIHTKTDRCIFKCKQTAKVNMTNYLYMNIHTYTIHTGRCQFMRVYTFICVPVAYSLHRPDEGDQTNGWLTQVACKQKRQKRPKPVCRFFSRGLQPGQPWFQSMERKPPSVCNLEAYSNCQHHLIFEVYETKTITTWSRDQDSQFFRPVQVLSAEAAGLATPNLSGQACEQGWILSGRVSLEEN